MSKDEKVAKRAPGKAHQRKVVTRKPRHGTACALAAAAKAEESADSDKTLAAQGPLADLRQERFCLELVRDPHATAAAIRLGYSPQTASRQTPLLLRIVKLRDRLAPLMVVLQGRRLARKRDLLRQLTDLMEFTGLTAAGSGRRVTWRPHTGPQGLALSAAGG